MRKTKKTRRNKDTDGSVLIGDASSNEGTPDRETPMEMRKPKIVFFQDPNIVEEFRHIKELQMERLKLDSRN